jgi:hypothetical protein
VTEQLAQRTIEVSSYLEFLDREYLTSYVGRGGSAVKFLVADDDPGAEELAAGLDRIGAGFQHVVVDAVTAKVHMIDQVFTEVARQLDWMALAGAVLHSAYTRSGFPPPGRQELGVAAVARHHEVDSAELYRSVRRSIEAIVLKDSGLSHEFRMAMLRLCQNRLGRGDVSASERETVIGWLRGERVPAAELRKVSLNSKVSRHNARALLLSLTRWLRLAGHAGLVLRVDLGRLAVSRRPPAGLRDGLYYSKAATLDAYELLRQLIDGTDEFEGLLVAVLVPAELVDDEVRGLSAYTALRLRIVDEVRDRLRINPYSTLVRIGRSPEVAA